MKFKIGEGTFIFMRTTFDCARNFKIGKNSVINSNCRLDNRAGLIIGDNVVVSNDVIILTADHDPNSPDFEGRSRPVFLNNYVWVGTRATILPGCKLDYGSVVAAGAVVTKDVNRLSIVAGVPAKKIQDRTNNLRYCPSYKRKFQ